MNTELDDLTDCLNEQFRRAEAILKGKNLGVAASVPIPDYGALEFAECDGKWQLCHVAGPETKSTIEPLVNASREVRIRASGLLRALLGQMNSQVLQETSRVRTAVEAVKDFNKEHG